jgi:hypothetical protein
MQKFWKLFGGAERKEYLFDKDTTLVCYVGVGCFNGSVDVTVYQLYPNRKIFKEKYLGGHWFWIHEYDYSIEKGVHAMIAHVMEDHKEENKIRNAWKEFNKNA